MPATIETMYRNDVTCRYVEDCGDGTWLLFEFAKPSDEIYQLRGSNQTRDAAIAWADGDDDAVIAPAVRRQQRLAAETTRVEMDLTLRERQELGRFAEELRGKYGHSSALGKLLAAVSRG